jgi:HK97 family phage prohead protease
MTILRSYLTAAVQPLADDEVLVTMSTSAQARDGHILEARGVRLDNYRANNIVLWQHNPSLPIGNAEDIEVVGDKIVARIRFAPLGISDTADTVRGLVKSGVVKGVSIGFDVIDAEPLDPARPRGGLRITAAEVLEASFVSVPADCGAQVTARAARRAPAPMAQGSLAERALVLAAAERGETLTPAMIARITAEAQRLGQTPRHRYLWLRAAGHAVNHETDDYLRRQADLRALTRDEGSF